MYYLWYINFWPSNGCISLDKKHMDLNLLKKIVVKWFRACLTTIILKLFFCSLWLDDLGHVWQLLFYDIWKCIPFFFPKFFPFGLIGVFGWVNALRFDSLTFFFYFPSNFLKPNVGLIPQKIWGKVRETIKRKKSLKLIICFLISIVLILLYKD